MSIDRLLEIFPHEAWCNFLAFSIRSSLDSERRILVTDIDSAIAKVSSSNPQETENVVAKKNDDSSVQLNITLPSSSVSLMPEINVLPATPMSTDFDDSLMFIVENPSFAVQERPLPPQLESESSKIFEEENSDMKSERKDEEVEGNKEKLSEEEVTSELNEESIEIKESLELQNDPSAEFEAKKKSKEESKEENDEPFYGADKEIERSEGLITESNDNDVNDKCEGKACEETWHELPDSSSESSKDSSSLPKERKKGRPKSTSEIMLAHCNDIDHNLNEETHSSENESKKNIERVNTFHLGSKSMVSIGRNYELIHCLLNCVTVFKYSCIVEVAVFFEANIPSIMYIHMYQNAFDGIVAVRFPFCSINSKEVRHCSTP